MGAATRRTCGPRAAACSNRSRKPSRSAAARMCRWTSFTSRSPSTPCGARCRSWWRPLRAPARRARRCRPTSIRIAPVRTISPASFRRGRTKAAREAMIQRLKDPALRPRIENEILHGIPGSNWYDHYTATGGWDGMLLVSLSNPQYKKFEGMRMNQVIEAVGKPPLDVLFELLEANGGSVPTVYFHHSEEDMRFAPQAAVRVDRVGRHGGGDRGAAGGRTSTSALLRNVSAHSGALRARGESADARRGHPQDDLGQRRQDRRFRPGPFAARHDGRCHDFRRRRASSTMPLSKNRISTRRAWSL